MQRKLPRLLGVREAPPSPIVRKLDGAGVHLWVSQGQVVAAWWALAVPGGPMQPAGAASAGRLRAARGATAELSRAPDRGRSHPTIKKVCPQYYSGLTPPLQSVTLSCSGRAEDRICFRRRGPLLPYYRPKLANRCNISPCSGKAETPRRERLGGLNSQLCPGPPCPPAALKRCMNCLCHVYWVCAK